MQCCISCCVTVIPDGDDDEWRICCKCLRLRCFIHTAFSFFSLHVTCLKINYVEFYTQIYLISVCLLHTLHRSLSLVTFHKCSFSSMKTILPSLQPCLPMTNRHAWHWISFVFQNGDVFILINIYSKSGIYNIKILKSLDCIPLNNIVCKVQWYSSAIGYVVEHYYMWWACLLVLLLIS